MIVHPSFTGLQYVIADRLERDGLDPARAREEAAQVAGLLWKLSRFVRRSDIPATVAFLREPYGTAQQLLWLGEGDEGTAVGAA
jgi:hypothetical protein